LSGRVAGRNHLPAPAPIAPAEGTGPASVRMGI